MPPAVEAIADRALAAVLGEDGNVRGTGFLVGPGCVLTCHHVVDGSGPVRVRDVDGSDLEADRDAIVCAPEIDLALIRVPGVHGSPVPLAHDAGGTTQYWTKGFHRLGGGIRSAFPVQGNITGTTSVSYSTYTTEYRIDNVLVLRDDEIEPGLSGAPVLDRTAGVVVGIVSTQLTRENERGGFAISVERAASHPALARVVALNVATVPAYGAFLNAPAARELCAAATRSAVEHLASYRGVDLSRRVPRGGVEAVSDRFLAADSRLLALVGPSGMGKSTELAALAERLRNPALLLRGSAVSSDCAGLGEAVASAITGASRDALLPDAPDRAVARAASTDGGLVVLLDGFNEIPIDPRTFEEWIARTRSWLSETSSRLIVSCRPELWQNVGSLLARPLDGREPVVALLGAFTDPEYEQAATAYGLPSGVSWPILHLPLVLNLYANLKRKPVPGSGWDPSINDVVELFVAEKARRLATGTGSEEVMRDRLCAAAAYMWDHDTEVLNKQAVRTLFGFDLADALVVEGVMSPTPAGYRFSFDDVADWLKAQNLDIDAEIDEIVSNGDSPRSWRRIAPLAYALRDIGRRKGRKALQDLLIKLVDSSARVNSVANRIAMETLMKTGDASPYLPAVSHIATMSAATHRNFFDVAAISSFWLNAPISLPGKLGLLRRLVPLDDSNEFRWRPKYWSDLDRLDYPGNPYHPDTALYYSDITARLIARAPADGLAELLPWLDDHTPLVRGQATVAHVAMAMFYWLRLRQEQPVWSAMIKAGGDRCTDLLFRLAYNNPLWLARRVVHSPAEAGDESLVVMASYHLLNAALPEELTDAVRETIADRYDRGLSGELRGIALSVLSVMSGRAHYAELLAQAYRAHEPGITAQDMFRAGRYFPDIIIPAFIETAIHGDRLDRDALASLGYSTDSRDARFQEAADGALRRRLEEGRGAVDARVCRYVESRLWRSSVAGNDLLALVQHIISAAPGSGREALAHPLMNSRALRDDEAQRSALLQEFLDAPDDPDALKEAARSIMRGVHGGTAPPNAVELLQQIIARLQPAEADRILFSEASDRRAVNELAGWLAAGKIPPLGKYTNRFKQRIVSGETPTDAVSQVISELIDESI